jgi:hypothetical protein
MRGCLSLPFRLLGLAILVLLGYVAWENRVTIRRAVHRATADPPRSPDAGAPAGALRRRAQARLDSLARGRVDSVLVAAEELEALVAEPIRTQSNGVLDSVAVELGDGEVTLLARLETDRLPNRALGPLAEWLSGRQAVEGRGPLALRRLGVGEWRVAQLKVRGLPLPRVLWSRLVDIVVPGQESTVTFPLPAWVTGIRITPAVAVLYGGVER